MSPVYLKYNELPSTHDHAITLVSKTKPRAATVIVAAHQTAGRGRYDRSWLSKAECNALLSCIFYPRHLSVNQTFYLNIISTLATTQLLEQHKIQGTCIKWPNDVLIQRDKIAGTLIQNQFSGMEVASTVISLGLNVNQIAWPTGTMATSMATVQQRAYVVFDIIEEWIKHLISNYESTFTARGRVHLKQLWMKQLMGFGIQASYVRTDKTAFEAILVDVEDNGELILEFEGKKQNFHMDELRFQMI